MLRLSKVQKAIEAIQNSTEFELEAAGVRADVSRWNSPYVSHRKVAYIPVQDRPGLLARAREWKVLIGTRPDEDYYPARPVCGCVGEWVGGKLPTHLVQELLDRAERLGLKVPDMGRLAHVWVLAPVLGAYCSETGGPVWVAAGEGNAPLRLPSLTEGGNWFALDEPRNAKFVLIPAEDVPPLPSWVSWWPGEVFGGVTRLTPDTDVERAGAKQARRVLVMVGSIPMYATHAEIGVGETGMTSANDVQLPEGAWIALAPLGANDDVRF